MVPTSGAARRTVRSVPRILLALGALVAAAVVGAAILSAEVVATGDLPFAEGVARVRVFDAFELYVSMEARRPTFDLLNGLVLVSCSAVALFAATLLPQPEGSRPRRLFVLAGLGTAYLTIDELFAVHESVGHNLGFLAALPGVSHPDDLLFALYAVPVAAFLLAFGDLLVADRLGRSLIGSAGVLFVVAAALDLLADERRVEDALEVVSSVCLLAALGVIAKHNIAPTAGGDAL